MPWSRSPIRRATLAALALLGAALACGSEEPSSSGEPTDSSVRTEGRASGSLDPEEAPPSTDQARAALERLRERLGESSRTVEEAHRAVEELRAELGAAERRLAAARSAREADQLQVEQAQQRLLRLTVSDSALFRRVQQALLDAPALQEVAIAAEVKDGIVTLRGTVPDPDTRRMVERIARGVPQVTSVDNRVRVAEEEAS